MGTITPYETVKGRRYRVRYRKPDHTAAEKRGCTTMGEAKLYVSMVTVAKSKGEYSTPAHRGSPSKCSRTAGCDPRDRRCQALVPRDARAGMEEPRGSGLGRPGDLVDPAL